MLYYAIYPYPYTKNYDDWSLLKSQKCIWNLVLVRAKALLHLIKLTCIAVAVKCCVCGKLAFLPYVCLHVVPHTRGRKAFCARKKHVKCISKFSNKVSRFEVGYTIITEVGSRMFMFRFFPFVMAVMLHESQNFSPKRFASLSFSLSL